MKNIFLFNVTIVLSLLLLACSEKSASAQLNLIESNEEKDTLNITEKFNGVSFVSERFIMKPDEMDPIVAVGANSVAFSPFGLIRKNNPEVTFNSEGQWEGETLDGIATAVTEAHKKGLKTMVKPQLWGWDIFTGTFHFETEKDWQKFEGDYEKFILAYAELAESVDSEVFCIGTELADFVEERPTYWDSLIVKVKKVYTGKLTYAENWDAFDKIHFAKQLDFIGVDAYFPLTEEISPTVKEYEKGWGKWKTKMENFSDTIGKPILFTEWGFRSIDKNGAKPWEFGNNPNINFENQSKAYEATFNQFWEEKWFAGGFLWKWFPSLKDGNKIDDGFTPQNKPGEKVLREQFLK